MATRLGISQSQESLLLKKYGDEVNSLPSVICSMLLQIPKSGPIVLPDEYASEEVLEKLKEVLEKLKIALEETEEKEEELQKQVDRMSFLKNELKRLETTVTKQLLSPFKVGQVVAWEQAARRNSRKQYFVFRTGTIQRISIQQATVYIDCSYQKQYYLVYEIQSASGKYTLRSDQTRIMSLEELEVAKKEYAEALEQFNQLNAQANTRLNVRKKERLVTMTQTFPTLDQLQHQIGEWSAKNFGNNVSKITGQLLYSQCALTGLVEEVGELNAITIKHHQGRSGFGPTAEGRAKYASERNDAVADILVFLLDYCHREGISAYDCLLKTWTQVVSKRRTDLPDLWSSYSHITENVETSLSEMAGDVQLTAKKSEPIEQNGAGWAEPKEESESSPQEGVQLSKSEAQGLHTVLTELLAMVEGQPYAKMAPRVLAFQKLLTGE